MVDASETVGRYAVHTMNTFMKNPPASQGWLVATVVLLCLSVFINYIDRGNLSTAAPVITNEFKLSASQLGFLLTSFFITYTLMQPAAGWLVDRFQASGVLLAGFVVWSLATIFTGLAGGFAALFALRLLLGVGEAAVFPASWKIISQCFTETQRGVANGVLLGATALGPAFGIFFGGLLIASFGWRVFFIGFGVASLIWVIPWIIFGSRCVTARSRGDAAGPDFRAILSTPSLWASSLAHAGAVYSWYFILTWIPYYLVHERHFSIGSMAVIGGSAYLLTAISTMTSGWLADRWIRANASPTLARKTFLCFGLIGAAAFMAACAISPPAQSVFFLLLACLCWGMVPPNCWAAVQTIAGSQATGRWSGIQNMIGSISGIVAPLLTGILVDRTGSFVLPFLICAAMGLVGAFAWAFLVGPIVQIDWSSRVRRIPQVAGAETI